MRRRVADDTVPPAELVDYRRWCADRGLAPFGHDLAPAQWGTWEEQRRQWAAAHGLTEDDLGGVGDQPWDESLI